MGRRGKEGGEQGEEEGRNFTTPRTRGMGKDEKNDRETGNEPDRFTVALLLPVAGVG